MNNIINKFDFIENKTGNHPPIPIVYRADPEGVTREYLTERGVHDSVIKLFLTLKGLPLRGGRNSWVDDVFSGPESFVYIAKREERITGSTFITEDYLRSVGCEEDIIKYFLQYRKYIMSELCSSILFPESITTLVKAKLQVDVDSVTDQEFKKAGVKDVRIKAFRKHKHDVSYGGRLTLLGLAHSTFVEYKSVSFMGTLLDLKSDLLEDSKFLSQCVDEGVISPKAKEEISSTEYVAYKLMGKEYKSRGKTYESFSDWESTQAPSKVRHDLNFLGEKYGVEWLKVIALLEILDSKRIQWVYLIPGKVGKADVLYSEKENSAYYSTEDGTSSVAMLKREEQDKV